MEVFLDLHSFINYLKAYYLGTWPLQHKSRMLVLYRCCRLCCPFATDLLPLKSLMTVLHYAQGLSVQNSVLLKFMKRMQRAINIKYWSYIIGPVGLELGVGWWWLLVWSFSTHSPPGLRGFALCVAVWLTSFGHIFSPLALTFTPFLRTLPGTPSVLYWSWGTWGWSCLPCFPCWSSSYRRSALGGALLEGERCLVAFAFGSMHLGCVLSRPSGSAWDRWETLNNNNNNNIMQSPRVPYLECHRNIPNLSPDWASDGKHSHVKYGATTAHTIPHTGGSNPEVGVANHR